MLCSQALDRSPELHRPDAPLLLLPLHSLQEASEQQAVLQKPPHGTRKVVLGTNLEPSRSFSGLLHAFSDLLR